MILQWISTYYKIIGMVNLAKLPSGDIHYKDGTPGLVTNTS